MTNSASRHPKPPPKTTCDSSPRPTGSWGRTLCRDLERSKSLNLRPVDRVSVQQETMNGDGPITQDGWLYKSMDRVDVVLQP